MFKPVLLLLLLFSFLFGLVTSHWTLGSDLTKNSTMEKVDTDKLRADIMQIKDRMEKFRRDPKNNSLTERERSLLGTVEPPKRYQTLIEPELWREFTAETIIMAVLETTTLTDNETLKMVFYIDHGGKAPIKDATIYLNIRDSNGSIVKHDAVPIKEMEPQSIGKVGSYSLDLTQTDYLEAPTTLEVEILLRFPGPRNPDCPNSNRYEVQVEKGKPSNRT